MVGWHHWLNGHEFDTSRKVRTGKPSVLRFVGSQRVGRGFVGSQRVGRDWTTPRGFPCLGTEHFLQVPDLKSNMTRNAYLKEFSSYCEGKLSIMQPREDSSLNQKNGCAPLSNQQILSQVLLHPQIPEKLKYIWIMSFPQNPPVTFNLL